MLTSTTFVILASNFLYYGFIYLKPVICPIKILDVIQFYIATYSHAGFGAKQGPRAGTTA